MHHTRFGRFETEPIGYQDDIFKGSHAVVEIHTSNMVIRHAYGVGYSDDDTKTLLAPLWDRVYNPKADEICWSIQDQLMAMAVAHPETENLYVVQLYDNNLHGGLWSVPLGELFPKLREVHHLSGELYHDWQDGWQDGLPPLPPLERLVVTLGRTTYLPDMAAASVKEVMIRVRQHDGPGTLFKVADFVKRWKIGTTAVGTPARVIKVVVPSIYLAIKGARLSQYHEDHEDEDHEDDAPAPKRSRGAREEIHPKVAELLAMAHIVEYGDEAFTNDDEIRGIRFGFVHPCQSAGVVIALMARLRAHCSR